MSKLTRRGMLLGSAAGAGIATIGRSRRAAAQASGPIRIGYQLPLSGAAATIGTQSRIAAEVAADYVNRNGGIMGRQIELVIRDDKTNPTDGIAGARELMSSGINLLATGFLTFDLLGAYPIIDQTDTLAISMSGVLMAITHEKYDRRVFRQNTDDYETTTGAATMAAARYPDVATWGSIGYDVGSTKDSVANFLVSVRKAYEKAGRKIRLVDPILVKIGTTDYKNEISKLLAGGVQGLFSEVYGAGGITLYQQAHAFGFSKQVKVIIDVGNEYAFANGMGRNIPNDFWAYTHWNPAIYRNLPLSQAIAKAYTEKSGDPYPGAFVYYGSTPVFIFADAIKAANGATDTDTLIKVLEAGAVINTIQGPWTFRKEDHQALCNLSFIKFDPTDAPPGWAVTDYVTIHGPDVLEPPSPGVAFKF